MKAILIVLLLSSNAYGRINGITLSELHTHLQSARVASDFFSSYTIAELAEFFYSEVLNSKAPQGASYILHEKQQHVAAFYIASFYMSGELTNEDSIDLAILIDKAPLYSKIASRDLKKRIVDSYRDLGDDMHHHGAHESFDGEHERVLEFEQLKLLGETAEKLRVHWYKAREMLKITMHNEIDN